MSDESRNRRSWNADSDAYQERHGQTLKRQPMAWGVWRIPESELKVLGNVEGLSTLELGCGAAQWTAALLQAGVRAYGIDLSERQLAHARRVCREAGVPSPLTQGSAECLPFDDESFDIVFCDHGATTFSPPEATIPEASRVLKAGGLLAFCMSSPIRDICFDPATDRISPSLVGDYFGLHTIEDESEVCYQLPYGAWIRLFRQHRFEIEDLVELNPPASATTTYSDFVPLDWARRWPGENIWKLRKRR